jgi:hypothetical protein
VAVLFLVPVVPAIVLARKVRPLRLLLRLLSRLRGGLVAGRSPAAARRQSAVARGFVAAAGALPRLRARGRWLGR